MTIESKVRFAGMDTHLDDGGGTLRFEFTGLNGEPFGEFLMDVSPTDLGTTDGLLGKGHRAMASIVREWAAYLDQRAILFEQR